MQRPNTKTAAMNIDSLKLILCAGDLDDFVDKSVLGVESPHFSAEKTNHVAKELASKFSVDINAINIHVVGSAKLGFGLFEKRTKSGETLPPFRPFGPESDIDLAIVSPPLYEAIWNELSIYANQCPWMPWDSGRLGDYMIYGWLRPDHFPKFARLRRCDDWWDLFRALSSNSRLGRRSIRGALYYSEEHLRRYQVRSLNQCRNKLETRE